MATDFTPWMSLLGGALIGAAALLLLWLNGRIAGVSGILGGALSERGDERRWRLLFLLGLIGAGAAGLYAWVGVEQVQLRTGWAQLLLAGLLVGYGTRLGSGCTSGHGVCGIGRLSPRSLVATAVFMVTAIITVWLQRHVF